LLAAAQQDGFQIALHAGGMMMGPNRQRAAAIREFVVTHDRRMSQMTGQPIGAEYRDVFLRDPDAMFDSEPPTVAILAAEESRNGLRMLERIQRARFVEGKHIAQPTVLWELAEELAIPSFESGYRQWDGEKTMEHVNASRALLHKVGGQGFPTFVLESEHGLQMVESSSHLGRVEAWRSMLKALV
jgi:putative protein-disulfide isomerase